MNVHSRIIEMVHEVGAFMGLGHYTVQCALSTAVKMIREDAYMRRHFVFDPEGVATHDRITIVITMNGCRGCQ